MAANQRAKGHYRTTGHCPVDAQILDPKRLCATYWPIIANRRIGTLVCHSHRIPHRHHRSHQCGPTRSPIQTWHRSRSVLKSLSRRSRPRSDCSVSAPKAHRGPLVRTQTPTNSGTQWNSVSVAAKCGVSKAAVIGWKNKGREIFSLTVQSRASKQVVHLSEGQFRQLEAALSVFMRSRMAYMNGASLFRADIVRRSAERINAELIQGWTKAKDEDAVDPEERKRLESLIASHEKFRCSQGWVYNFMRRNNFHSIKGGGEEGFVCEQRLFTERTKLQQKLCCYEIGSICNTDEVALLYSCLLYTSPSPRDQRGSRMPSSA